MGSRKPAIEELFQTFDSGYRGDCNFEDDDQISFSLWVGHVLPWVNMFHVTNEFKGTKAQGERLNQKGRVKGVSDNIILTPGYEFPLAVIEAKRRDRTKSKWQDGQREFLNKVARDGGFAAVAYGLDEMKKSLKIYLCGSDDDAIFSAYVERNKNK